VSFDGVDGFVPVDAGWPTRRRAENEARIRRKTPHPLFSGHWLEGVIRGGPLRRHIARMAKEARFAAGAQHYDLCHCVVTLPPGPTAKPMIPLIHDVSIQRFPETHPAERVRAFNRWIPEILKCPVINTVSAFSAREIATVLGYPLERIVVTHPGIETFFLVTDWAAEEAALAGFELGARRLILLVGTQEPRKNIDVALTAFAALPEASRANSVLMVVGGRGWGQVVVPATAEPLIRAGDIRFSGYVSRLQLRALYRRAAQLVFPSMYEGFGMPVLEALACGTAVAVSAGSSLEEAAGPHGQAIPSNDVEGWRDAMQSAIEGPDATAEQRAERQNWARGFTWCRTGSRTLAMYRGVLYGGQLPSS
jgi:alpha-1,3-rhamnosyl/mannosyltransferase